ncbi:hypothetical protein C8R44DRAFT_771481 [Mycena epipterygia]|nr:hypothetical protein C8R44DRAFT_771481 [Mycena epipterygia]
MKPTVQKENFQANESRTTWMQESKPSLRHAKVASVPLKSILKNSTTPIPSAYMPPAAKPPTDGPLACPTYFMSPAETILESTGPNAHDVSFHDLIEAYNTFSNRIRSQIRVILSVDAPQPALVSLKEYSHEMGKALRRDLKRIREQPSPQSRRTSFLDESFQSITEADEEDIRVARDLALLGHHVLRFLSEIFSFPPLYSIFSANDLRSVLNELLILGLAPSIPIPTSRRSWTLVVWILSVQNLPSVVISPAKREIVSVLKRALEGEIGKDQAKADGLKASNQLLKHYPSSFISPLLDIFPCILQYLIADSSALRLQAVNALGGFALAKINTLSTAHSCHVSLSATLSTFINSQTTKQKSVLRLRNLVTAALSSHNPSPQADSPFWAIQLLASIIILVDDSFFSNARVLKFTLQSLSQLAGHKQKLVSAFHPYVWKCLIWVFSRLPIHPDGEDTRHPIFLTLKQDLRGGIGLALILSLIGSAPNDGVMIPLMVVSDMLSSSNQVIQVDGISLLTTLLYTPPQPKGSEGPQNLNLLVPQLFDGSIQSKRDSTVRSFDQLSVSQVRQLSDSEILYHWNDLVGLWVQAMNILLRQDFAKLSLDALTEYRQNLLHGWQSLLLMPSDLTQGLAHLTTPEPYASRIADLICSFIVFVDTPSAQVQQLALVSRMWRITTSVFQRDWLSSAAETVLGAVLKHGYDLAEEPIRDMWAELCSQLISFGLPSALGFVREQSEAQMPAEVQRQLWTLAVKSEQKPDDPVPWIDLAYLLSIPFRAWTMAESEVGIWDNLLRRTVANANANSNSVQPTVVVEHIFKLIGDVYRFSQSPKEFLTLLSHVDLSGRDTLPEGVISAVNQALCDLYPEQALASTSLQLIRRLQDIILSAPPTLALPLLLALQDSICKWLEDDGNALVEDVRKEIIACLFSTPLSTICDMEPSGQNLVSISRFLATVADGDAFERFWRVTYHGRPEFYELYPENIKTSLRAFSDVFGGSLAADLSLEGDSQRESSCAPDSQPSSSFDYYADESRYAGEADTIGMGDTRVMEDRQDINSASTIRGYSPTQVTPVRPILLGALEQLQEYSSHLDDSSLLDASSHKSLADAASSSVTIHPGIGSQPRGDTSGSSKRRAEVKDTLASKRRKTSRGVDFVPSRSNAVAGPSRHLGETVSEPISRRDSAILSEHASSQPVLSRRRMGMRRLVLDYVEVPTYEESRRLRQAWALPTPSPSFRPRSPRQPKPKPPSPDDADAEEDYASWETGMSLAEAKHVQNTFGRDTQYPSSDESEEGESAMDVDESRNDVTRSPSVGASSRRSHTVPIPPREHPPPLRRNKTSARLDALERAYAAVADDASQIPAQDLVQATRWVHKIGAALNEQMSRKLDKP